MVVVSEVCMCTCGRAVGMSYIALCSGAHVKYINVLNLHQLHCTYIQGMSLQNAHSVILIYDALYYVRSSMDPVPPSTIHVGCCMKRGDQQRCHNEVQPAYVSACNGGSRSNLSYLDM